MLTETALKSFDSLFNTAFANIDVVVQARQAFTPSAASGGNGGGSELNPVPEDVLSKVSAVDGVRYAEGSVQSFAQIIDPQTGKVVQSGGAPMIGTSWSPHVSGFTIVSGGAAPSGPDQVAIDAETASTHHLAVGDQVRVITPASTAEYQISGLLRFGTSNSLLGASIAAFDLPTAQHLFQRPNEFD